MGGAGVAATRTGADLQRVHRKGNATGAKRVCTGLAVQPAVASFPVRERLKMTAPQRGFKVARQRGTYCGITPRRHLRAKGVIPRDSSRRVGTGDSGPRVTTERFPSPEDLGEREKSLRFVYSWEKVEIPAVMTQCQRISFGALRGITPPPAMALAEISRTSDLQEGSDSEPHYLDRVPDFTGPWTAHLDFPTPTCPD